MKPRSIGRREALSVMGAAGAALALGCGTSPTGDAAGGYAATFQVGVPV